MLPQGPRGKAPMSSGSRGREKMWVRGFLDMQMPTLMAESEEELKSLLMKVKEESESWLKAQHSENKDHGIWSHHFIANRCGNSG